jgi:uncharacterized Zn-binding protein involved in type VI secretion
MPAAKANDRIIATDTHIVNGTSAKLPFDGIVDGNLSADVIIEHRHAAMVDSTATNTPAHVPSPDKPASNRGVIVQGSGTVLINHRPAARDGDKATTCNDPEDRPVGTVVASSTVIVGG